MADISGVVLHVKPFLGDRIPMIVFRDYHEELLKAEASPI